MKHYAWDPDKNQWLKAERDISFEEVIFHIENGDEVDIFDHPNQERYPGQSYCWSRVAGQISRRSRQNCDP